MMTLPHYLRKLFDNEAETMRLALNELRNGALSVTIIDHKGHEVIISPIHPNRPARVVKVEMP